MGKCCSKISKDIDAVLKDIQASNAEVQKMKDIALKRVPAMKTAMQKVREAIDSALQILGFPHRQHGELRKFKNTLRALYKACKALAKYPVTGLRTVLKGLTTILSAATTPVNRMEVVLRKADDSARPAYTQLSKAKAQLQKIQQSVEKMEAQVNYVADEAATYTKMAEEMVADLKERERIAEEAAKKALAENDKAAAKTAAENAAVVATAKGAWAVGFGKVAGDLAKTLKEVLTTAGKCVEKMDEIPSNIEKHTAELTKAKDATDISARVQPMVQYVQPLAQKVNEVASYIEKNIPGVVMDAVAWASSALGALEDTLMNTFGINKMINDAVQQVNPLAKIEEELSKIVEKELAPMTVAANQLNVIGDTLGLLTGEKANQGKDKRKQLRADWQKAGKEALKDEAKKKAMEMAMKEWNDVLVPLLKQIGVDLAKAGATSMLEEILSSVFGAEFASKAAHALGDAGECCVAGAKFVIDQASKGQHGPDGCGEEASQMVSAGAALEDEDKTLAAWPPQAGGK